MSSNHGKIQSVRYDVPTEINAGPQSRLIKLEEVVAKNPIVKRKIVIPPYSRPLSQQQEDALRKRCSTDDLQEKVKERINDKNLASGLRSRLLTWIEEGAPGNAETYRLKRKRKRREAEERARMDDGEEDSINSSLSTSTFSSSSSPVSHDSNINEALDEVQIKVPDSFKFMADARLASAYHYQGGRLDESAIKNPVPSRLLKVQNPQDNEEIQSEQSEDQKHFMLCINIFARPPRGMWIKEKFDRIVRSASGNDTSADNVHQSTEKVEEWRENEKFEIPEQSKPGPKTMLGRSGPYEALQLSQQIEIRSDCTLQDLRDGFICRMDDLPEAVDREKTFHSWSKSVQEGDLSSIAPQMQSFAGHKRETDSCFLIEDVLYGQKGSKDEGKSYVDLLSSHFAKPNEDGVPARASSSTQKMEEIKLDSINLCTGKLYWFLHQGSCEHVWTITSIRQARLSEQNSKAEAITHYLKYNFLVRPIVRWARPTKRMESYSLDLCNLCEERHACMMVIGGERFRPTNKEIRLDGLKEENVSVCETCWNALHGEKQDSLEQLVQRVGTGSIADRSDTDFVKVGAKDWTVIPLLE